MAKAARIMITMIPAELAERLEPYRGRFNISAVYCGCLASTSREYGRPGTATRR